MNKETQNTGKKLERLVEEIERLFLPSGFMVEKRHLEFDERNKIKAEFDIYITGRIGTTDFKWLIECRDRPSEGPAPAQWIEQLVGRRERFNLNKVSAVSTTGFESTAAEYAKEKGIELRKMDILSMDEIKSWFQISHLDLYVHRGKFTHAEIKIDPNAQQGLIESAKQLISTEFPNMRVFVDQNGKFSNILQIWENVVQQNPQIFDGISPGGEAVKKCIRTVFKPDDQYFIATKNGHCPLLSILFEAELEVENRKIPVSEVTRYKILSSEQGLAETVLFECDIPEQQLDIKIHHLVEGGRTIIQVIESSEN